MARVYRIENALGHGMYRNDSQIPCMTEMQPFGKHYLRFPTPNEDSKLWAAVKDKALNDNVLGRHLSREGEKYRFGFRSIRQLKGWVFKREWRKAIAESDLQLVIYDASDVLFGDCQVMFKRDWSKRVVVPWEKAI